MTRIGLLVAAGAFVLAAPAHAGETYANADAGFEMTLPDVWYRSEPTGNSASTVAEFTGPDSVASCSISVTKEETFTLETQDQLNARVAGGALKDFQLEQVKAIDPLAATRSQDLVNAQGVTGQRMVMTMSLLAEGSMHFLAEDATAFLIPGALVMIICTATQADYDSAGAAIGNLVQSFKSTR